MKEPPKGIWVSHRVRPLISTSSRTGLFAAPRAVSGLGMAVIARRAASLLPWPLPFCAAVSVPLFSIPSGPIYRSLTGCLVV